LVSARIIRKKRRICRSPIEVMLEALRAQERIDQICAYRGGNDSGKDVFHGRFPKGGRNRARTPRQ
jgi:hypothetical protein